MGLLFLLTFICLYRKIWMKIFISGWADIPDRSSQLITTFWSMLGLKFLLIDRACLQGSELMHLIKTGQKISADEQSLPAE